MNVELVAFGIEHVDEVLAPFFNSACLARAQLHEPGDFGIHPAPSLVVGRASRSADVQVEVDPVLDDLPFWNPLEKDARADAIRIDHGAGRVPLTLGDPLRLQEVRPRAKAGGGSSSLHSTPPPPKAPLYSRFPHS